MNFGIFGKKDVETAEVIELDYNLISDEALEQLDSISSEEVIMDELALCAISQEIGLV